MMIIIIIYSHICISDVWAQSVCNTAGVVACSSNVRPVLYTSIYKIDVL